LARMHLLPQGTVVTCSKIPPQLLFSSQLGTTLI
jgi:hypothetical protein